MVAFYNSGVVQKWIVFFFHVCQSEHITKDLLSTISVKNSRPWFAPNVKTSWGLSCAHIAPRGGFDLGQPALHGPWDEGWSNGCPFEVSQNSSAEAPNMYREVPRLPPARSTSSPRRIILRASGHHHFKLRETSLELSLITWALLQKFHVWLKW